MREGTEERARTVDCGALYGRKRAELVALLTPLDDEGLATPVPATPLWRVRDAMAHVVGITADLNALDFSAPDPDAWTQRQVDQRRDASIADMAAEWERESPRFEEGLRLLGHHWGSHYVGDLHAHIQDVRSALHLDADRDPTTMLVSLDFYLDSFGETLDEHDTGSVSVGFSGETHVVGSGPARATVDGDAFDVLRTLSGRRSLAQARALEWTGDVDEIAPLLSRYPMPEHDLTD